MSTTFVFSGSEENAAVQQIVIYHVNNVCESNPFAYVCTPVQLS